MVDWYNMNHTAVGYRFIHYLKNKSLKEDSPANRMLEYISFFLQHCIQYHTMKVNDI